MDVYADNSRLLTVELMKHDSRNVIHSTDNASIIIAISIHLQDSTDPPLSLVHSWTALECAGDVRMTIPEMFDIAVTLITQE